MRKVAIKFTKVAVGFAIVLILGLEAWKLFGPMYYASVIVNNKTTNRIDKVTVDLCGERAELLGIESNETQNAKLKIGSDCDYKVDVSFANGAKLNGQLGYVTHGVSVNDELLVFDDKIEIGKSKFQ